MDITDTLNRVLSLLSASIIKKDNYYCIYDSINNTIEKIDLKKKKYIFKLVRDEGTYLFSYDQQGFSINRGSEIIYYSCEGVTYADREYNSRFNKTFVHLNSLASDFYEKTDIDNGRIEESIKTASSGKHIKKAYSLYQDGITYKKDTVTVDIDDSIIVNHTTRKYNKNGSLDDSSSFDEELQIPIEEYVSSELHKSEIVKSAFTKFNNFIPGIGLYFAESNPLLIRIVSEDKKTTK